VRNKRHGSIRSFGERCPELEKIPITRQPIAKSVRERSLEVYGKVPFTGFMLKIILPIEIIDPNAAMFNKI